MKRWRCYHFLAPLNFAAATVDYVTNVPQLMVVPAECPLIKTFARASHCLLDSVYLALSLTHWISFFFVFKIFGFGTTNSMHCSHILFYLEIWLFIFGFYQHGRNRERIAVGLLCMGGMMLVHWNERGARDIEQSGRKEREKKRGPKCSSRRRKICE